MQFSISNIFTVALMAASVVSAQSTTGGFGRGRGRWRGGKGKGKGGCTDATAPGGGGGLPTTFLTSTAQATLTTTIRSASSSSSVVVVTSSTPPVEPTPTPSPDPVPTPVTVSSSAPSAAPSSDPGSSGLSADEKAAFDAHNKARADVGQAPLKWDAKLAADAAAYAKELVKIGSLQHASGTGQGENLYWQSNDDGKPLANGANAWISEKKNYNGQKIGEGDFGSYGHYTQVVWSKTDAVGIAAAADGKGGFYVVGRYTPAGNFVGQTPF